MIKTILKFGIMLLVICFIASLLLSVTYVLTSPKIAQQKKQKEKEALLEIMPQALGGFEPVAVKDEVLYYKATGQDKKLLGYIFKVQAKGYSSKIDIMAGVTPKGEITGIKVLSQQETPGLGSRIVEVKTTATLIDSIKNISKPRKEEQKILYPWFQEQFRGKKIENLVVVKGKTQDKIEAITGATITTEAVTDAVKEKAEEILKKASNK